MRRRKSKSKRLAKAKEDHAKFLAKYGIDGKRKPKVTGASCDAPDYHRRITDQPTSDLIPAHGTPKKGYGHGGRVIGQAYNKGPLMVLGHKSELANAKRRDR